MVSASMPSLPVSLKPTRRTSAKRTPAGISRWAYRRSSAWRSPMTSAVLSPSWHPKTRGGSRAIPSTWMAAQSSESKQRSGKARRVQMTRTTPEQNKALVLEAFDTLFNKRDYATAERFWSSNYVQHSAHIEPGREGLFNLIKALPPSLKYEPGVIGAAGDVVLVTG